MSIGQRVSELEGIRLKNEIVPWGHNFDPSGSSLTWHVYPIGVHLPWKFHVSATFRSKIWSFLYGFAKGSRGGTWHVPRGTWRHVTNAIVVPALWRIFLVFVASRSDLRFRSYSRKSLDRLTDTQTGAGRVAKIHPAQRKSPFIRMDYVHSSSLRFWTRGHMFRAISFEISFVSRSLVLFFICFV